MTQPTENGEIRDTKGRFVQGNPGGPGRPVGSISIIGKIKRIWEENPERFNSFVEEVLADEKLRGQLINHIDGAPKQSTDITSGGEAIQPLLVKFLDAESNGDTEGV